MAERADLRPDRPRRHVNAPRLPARSEMNYRDGRPDLELYDALEAIHEGSDDPDDSLDKSLKAPAGRGDAVPPGWRS